MSPQSPWIFHNGRPKMVDAPLTLTLGHNGDVVAIIFSWKGGQKFDYGSM